MINKRVYGMTNLKEYKLSELLEIKYGKDHKNLSTGNIPCYGTGGLMRYVDKYLYNKKSILIPRKGSLQNLYFMDGPFWTVDTLFWSKINEELVNPKFLYYNIKTLDLSKLDEGSAVPSLTTKSLNQISIRIPLLETQKKIASILSSLDDKIEINNEMNKTLEDIAQTLFKNWFIDFEFPNEEGKPYKSSGGKFVESELGLIPEGWRVGGLEEIGVIASGGTPSRANEEYYTNNGIPWITPKDLSINKNKFIERGIIDITKEGLAKSSTKLLPKGTILYSSRAPIGYLAISKTIVTTNQGFKSIIPNNFENTEFIYQLLKEITPYIESVAGGSTFKEISSQGMKNIKIIIPSNLILKRFYKMTSFLNIKIESLEKEIQMIKEISKRSLPKLMNGEIEI
jgi:type I restriction enzyme S subunit